MSGEFLNLPWQIQIALASGYAGYLVAYTGIRGHHKAVDVTFITLIFSLIASAVLALNTLWDWAAWDSALWDGGNHVSDGLRAFVVTCLAGAIWRKWLRWGVRWCFRMLDLSWSDDDPSALASISDNTKYPVSQVAVLLDDGTWLRCDDAGQFRDAPFAPYKLGPTGDIALYLTHEEPPGKKAKELRTVRDSEWGDRITYIPAPRICRIVIRHKGKGAS